MIHEGSAFHKASDKESTTHRWKLKFCSSRIALKALRDLIEDISGT